jgi:hypothetical protein
MLSASKQGIGLVGTIAARALGGDLFGPIGVLPSRSASAIPQVDHDGPAQLVGHRDAEGEQLVVAHRNSLLAATAAGGQPAACWRPCRKNSNASSTEPIASQVTVAPKG